jgi:glucan biosynthesis protein C
MTQRRYDIDWLRVIAIGLLIIYHAAIAFQPWGGLIGFIQDNETIEWIWYPMSMLNMWRIPILFFVSGMGVYFSMRKRKLVQLMSERSKRILLPFIFGVFVIVPIHILIWQEYYFQDLKYHPEQSHLWFLLNIFTYTIVLAPLLYLVRKFKINKQIQYLKAITSQAGIFLLVASLFVLETGLLKPELYTLYAYSTHGWLMGFIAFGMGLYIVSLGKKFWNGFKIWKWVYLIIAIALYINRLLDTYLEAPFYLNAIETTAWVFAVFGFFYQYTNKNNSALRYLSKAAYPVYIIHMMVQFGISSFIFPIGLPANLNLLLLSMGTLVISMIIYHFLIRPFKWIRPFFGMKIKRNMSEKNSNKYVLDFSISNR